MVERISKIQTLKNLGAIVQILEHKNNYGHKKAIIFSFGFENGFAPKDICEVLKTFKTPPGYTYRITINDGNLGSLGISDSGVTDRKAGKIDSNPISALEHAIENIKDERINSICQDIVERSFQEFNLAEGAKLHEKISSEFGMDIRSVDIHCYPAAWNFN
jgi:hypothetical protein